MTSEMTGLNDSALQALAEAGIAEAEWIAYGGWSDGEWHGDACGCTDDRCIGYHHDDGEECRCLPVLIDKRAESHEAHAIWQDYRAAVEANDGRGDPDAYQAAWSRAETWVRRYHPYALTFSLDAVVYGVRGISATYPPLRDGSIPSSTGAMAEGDGYRQRLWIEGTTPDGHMGPPGPAPDLSRYDTLPHDALEWFLSDHPWAKAERVRRREAHYAGELQRAGEVHAWTEKIDQLEPGVTGKEFERSARKLAELMRPMADDSRLRAQVESAEPDELFVEEERRRLVIHRHADGDDAYQYPVWLTGQGAAMCLPPGSGFRSSEPEEPTHEEPTHMMMSPEQLAAMAPIELTYPGSDVVNVRMQTEHLYAVEKHLAERGVPAAVISEHFDELHRLPPQQLDVWLAAITTAYNNAGGNSDA